MPTLCMCRALLIPFNSRYFAYVLKRRALHRSIDESVKETSGSFLKVFWKRTDLPFLSALAFIPALTVFSLAFMKVGGAVQFECTTTTPVSLLTAPS